MTPSGHVGASILATYIIEGCVLGNEVTPLALGVSALVGLLPDMDGLIAMAIKRQRPSQQKLRHHQFASHTPIFYLLMTLGISRIVPVHLTALFGMLTFLHLFLDSWSTDDGIMWLWPFNRRQLALFPRNLHAGGAHGLAFYRRHVRCWRIIVPEILLLAGGTALAYHTLMAV